VSAQAGSELPHGSGVVGQRIPQQKHVRRARGEGGWEAKESARGSMGHSVPRRAAPSRWSSARAESERSHHTQEHRPQLPTLASCLGGPSQGALLPGGTTQLAPGSLAGLRYKDASCQLCHVPMCAIWH
jgi:hypothetical protein